MTPMLANEYSGENITGWLMSEKLDGIRAIWNGYFFESRNGNTFDVPDSITEAMPAGIALDGEFWLGYGKLQQMASIARSSDSDWSGVKFCVFDAPEHGGSFRERIAYCSEILDGNPVAEIVPHHLCKGGDDLESFMESIIAKGGEGVMMKDPFAPYIEGRTYAMLKYKPFFTDEAIVIDHEQGKGKFAGMVGAIVVKFNGITFKLGSGIPNSIRKNPPAIGKAVTFSYLGFTDNGTPRHAAFIGVRDYE